jgi:hypothetical protein
MCTIDRFLEAVRKLPNIIIGRPKAISSSSCPNSKMASLVNGSDWVLTLPWVTVSDLKLTQPFTKVVCENTTLPRCPRDHLTRPNCLRHRCLPYTHVVYTKPERMSSSENSQLVVEYCELVALAGYTKKKKILQQARMELLWVQCIEGVCRGVQPS